jgi:hypothetical protein
MASLILGKKTSRPISKWKELGKVKNELTDLFVLPLVKGRKRGVERRRERFLKRMEKSGVKWK